MKMLKEERECREFIRAAIQNECDIPMAMRFIRAMVRAVREDAAKVADDVANYGGMGWDYGTAQRIAKAIRRK